MISKGAWLEELRGAGLDLEEVEMNVYEGGQRAKGVRVVHEKTGMAGEASEVADKGERPDEGLLRLKATRRLLDKLEQDDGG